MYELNDTIMAISSPTSEQRAIVRITGPATIDVLRQVFSPHIGDKAGLVSGSVAVDAELKVDAELYLFLAPHSYTGETLAEIHIHTSTSITEAVMAQLLSRGLRVAGPGEFTARSFLNGKIDLAQAEAVGEIVASSNRLQLAAAEKLLSGQLAETTAKVRSMLMDCISLIEAGLDFSGEDIEFITRDKAVERLTGIKNQLEQLLSASISYESVIDLPAVGIAGAPNAGKSSLLNRLLGRARSIVSEKRRTTRDVLTGELSLAHCRCVLFDCAGLTPAPNNVLDELAQQAAIKALRNSSVVVFCTDISKDARPKTQDPRQKSQDFGLWTEEIGLWSLVRSLGAPALIPVATKCDLLSEEVLSNRLAKLGKLFAVEFLATSVRTDTGIELLRDTIDRKIIELALGRETQNTSHEPRVTRHGVALTARHRQALTWAIENVSESINELKAGNDEITAMMLRTAYQAVSNIEQPRGIGVDEQILERIFSRFCIGK